jgi:hypothetical protein
VCACRPMKNTLGRKDVKEFVKVIVSSKDDKVVGFHMVGSEAAEILQVHFIPVQAFLSTGCFLPYTNSSMRASARRRLVVLFLARHLRGILNCLKSLSAKNGTFLCSMCETSAVLYACRALLQPCTPASQSSSLMQQWASTRPALRSL